MSSEYQGGADTERGRTNMDPSTRKAEAEEWRKKAERLFQNLPQPSIQPLPGDHAFDLSRYKNRLSCTPAEAWQKCADLMRKHDADACKAYREEIDTLLVFAGLFSAVVTAFTIESYQWLQSDPNDAIIALLSQIAQPGNQSQRAPVRAGLPDAVSVRINAYWFVSLTLSLAVALLAIVCKQWVREFERHGNESHCQFISVRQTKLEGFEGWGVSSIVAVMPLLLQSGLALFALGVTELLWQLHKAVAIVVLIPTSAAALFYAVTTALPGLQLVCRPFGMFRTMSQCPFKSPQALLGVRMHILLLYSLWCPRCDPCPRFIFYIVEYCHRKCLVFVRRLYASLRPEDIPNSRNDSESVANSLEPAQGRLCRMLQPWQRDESTFYTHGDQINRLNFQSWCRRHFYFLLCWRSHPLSYCCRPVAPRLTQCSSWMILDREFTLLRDVTIARDAVSPTSCFRGLSWLLKNADQSGLQEWIWLSIWDISLHVSSIERWHNLRTHNLHDGILHLAPEAARSMNRSTWRPLSLALAYAYHAKIDSTFISELFVQLVPHIDECVAAPPRTDDDDIWYSGFHAMLARLLDGHRWLEYPRKLFSLATRTHGVHSGGLSQQELGCLIALHFHIRLLHGEDVFDCSEESKLLFDDALACLLTHDFPKSLADSHELKSTFSALAVAFDRFLEQRSTEDLSATVPRYLARTPGVEIYLVLISSARDESGPPSRRVAAAKARLARQMANRLRRAMKDYGMDLNKGHHIICPTYEAINMLTGGAPELVLEPQLHELAAGTVSASRWGNEDAVQGPSALPLESSCALDAELETDVSGNATDSQSHRDSERIAPGETAAISPADRDDATRTPGAASTSPVAPRNVDLATVIPVPAPSGALASPEPDGTAAVALGPRDVDAGMRIPAAHGDEEISALAAEAGRDPACSGTAAGTVELVTARSETDGVIYVDTGT